VGPEGPRRERVPPEAAQLPRGSGGTREGIEVRNWRPRADGQLLVPGSPQLRLPSTPLLRHRPLLPSRSRNTVVDGEPVAVRLCR